MSAEKNDKDTLLKIELDSFSNTIAMDMGIRIIELARSRNQAIAIEISRLNQSVFLYVEDGLPADKHNWLRRKANLAKYFEESSLAVRHTLERRSMSNILASIGDTKKTKFLTLRPTQSSRP